MIKAAVVFSGCGVFDGSEIHEAVSILVHLSRGGVQVGCFAPDKPQMHVVNHLTGKPAEGETRSVLVESARIARGKIAPLSALRAAAFDAAFFPGGFGAAKNLCDFATRGAAMDVDPEVERVVREFHAAGKPVGMCCIAPVIGARVLGATVTIGDDAGTAKAIAEMGGRNVVKRVTEACTDERNHLTTSPAYMYGDAPVHAVFDGIGEMVRQTLAQIR